MKVKIFVLIMALVLLLISCEDMFETMGRWNLNDPEYDKEGNPIDQPDKPPIEPSNLKVSFFLEDNDFDEPRVRLQWQNNSSYTRKTVIERAEEGSNNFVVIGEVPYVLDDDGHDEASVQYVDDTQDKTSLSKCGYVYRVKAVNPGAKTKDNPDGSSDYAEKLFYCPPVVDFESYGNSDFTGDVTTAGGTGVNFYFQDLSYGLIDSYMWNFGDNNERPIEKTTVPNPSEIKYSNEGLYNITLTAAGPGGTVKKEKFEYISIGIPRSIIELYFDQACTDLIKINDFDEETNQSIPLEPGDEIDVVRPGSTIYVKDKSVFTNPGWNYWRFDNQRVEDGSIAFERNDGDSRIYSFRVPDVNSITPGRYNFFLRVENNINNQSFIDDAIQIINIDDPKLNFNFLGDTTHEINKKAGDQIWFQNTSEGFGAIYQYNFGDSLENLTAGTISHTYNNPGSYQCSLTMTTAFNEVFTTPIEDVLKIIVDGGETRVPIITNITNPRNLTTCDIDKDGDSDLFYMSGNNSETKLNWIENTDENTLIIRDFVDMVSPNDVFDFENVTDAEILTVANSDPLLVVSRKPDSSQFYVEVYEISDVGSENRGVAKIRNISISAAQLSFKAKMDNSILVIGVHSVATDEEPQLSKYLLNLSDDTQDVTELISSSAPPLPSQILLENWKNDYTGYEIILASTNESGNNVHYFDPYKDTNDNGTPDDDSDDFSDIFYYGIAISTITNAKIIQSNAIDGTSSTDLIIYNGSATSWYDYDEAKTSVASRFEARTNSEISGKTPISGFYVGKINSTNNDILFGWNGSLYWYENNGDGDNDCEFTHKIHVSNDLEDVNSCAVALLDSDSDHDIIAAEESAIYWYPDEMFD